MVMEISHVMNCISKMTGRMIRAEIPIMKGGSLKEIMNIIAINKQLNLSKKALLS
jgi:hypothetical protein